MVTFPNGKINLGLNIISKRPDGYHNLETVFYPFQIFDALEVVEAKENSFRQYGLPVAGNAADNLCLRAYALLKKDFDRLPPLDICLLKAIPMGAGLGGGSADGAFMLCMLNKLYNLQLTNEALIGYALQLGSDCPFFIINKPCFATGRGENLHPVEVDLSAYSLMLVNPGIHVSTKEAFGGITPQVPEKALTEVVAQPVSTWRTALKNDFEATVFKHYPAIEQVKQSMYSAGALYASMTGSGSSVYGIFEKESLPAIEFPAEYLSITLP